MLRDKAEVRSKIQADGYIECRLIEPNHLAPFCLGESVIKEAEFHKYCLMPFLFYFCLNREFMLKEHVKVIRIF